MPFQRRFPVVGRGSQRTIIYDLGHLSLRQFAQRHDLLHRLGSVSFVIPNRFHVSFHESSHRLRLRFQIILSRDKVYMGKLDAFLDKIKQHAKTQFLCHQGFLGA